MRAMLIERGYARTSRKDDHGSYDGAPVFTSDGPLIVNLDAAEEQPKRIIDERSCRYEPIEFEYARTASDGTRVYEEIVSR